MKKMFDIYLGVPEFSEYWKRLKTRVDSDTASKSERLLYKKIGKAMRYLSSDPFHPGLSSHEISALSRRYGMKIWESYIENDTPAAGRLYWVYGPQRNSITVIGFTPHPDDKPGAYKRIVLSSVQK